MKAKKVKELKRKLKNELHRRNGYGSVAHLAANRYNFDEQPEDGKPIKAEHGEKTVNLLLQIEDVDGLTAVRKGDPIPEAFNEKLIEVVEKLAGEEMNGESEFTARMIHTNKKAERSSCRAECTGLCVGSCIGFCNGCHGCTGCNGTCEGERAITGAEQRRVNRCVKTMRTSVDNSNWAGIKAGVYNEVIKNK